MLTQLFKKLFKCPLNKCNNRFLGCYCGGKKKSEASPPPPPPPSPVEQAREIQTAKNELDPQSAATQFGILSNPQYGLLPITQLFESTRQQVFPQETSIRNQLASNIFQNLFSPTGIAPSQQEAINYRRGQAQSELVKALRERANLGGGLYGGRSIQEEGRAVADLQKAFSEEDIGREERAQLNSIQAALPFLQILFPDVGLTPPQFASPVQSPEAYSSAILNARGQDINRQIAAEQQKSALQMALFQGLGTAAGGFLGNPSRFSASKGDKNG